MTRRIAAAASAALVGALVLPVPALAADPATTDLVISEYAEGSGLNKAVELYNGSGADLDVSGYELRLYSNGRTLTEGPSGTYNLPAGTVLADGTVWTVTNSGYALPPGGTIDDTNDSAVNFNGNDTLVLVDAGGTVVDSFGRTGDDTTFAQDVTLRRTDFAPDTEPTDPWTDDAFASFPSDTSDDIGVSPTGDTGGGGGGGGDGEPCATAEQDLTLISEVQGSGADPDADADSPIDGTAVTIRAVVTLADPDLGGYFVQEEPDDQDGDPTSSEGLFVFDQRALPVEGETVELTGEVTAFNGLTQLSFPDAEVCDVPLVVVEPTPLTLPLDRDGREAVESMLVTTAQDLEVSALFTAYRFGELGLAYPGPLTQPTSAHAPDSPDAVALAALNEASLLKVNDRDEASSQFSPFPWELFDEDLSAGDTMPAGRLVGVLRYSFGEFKVEPLDNEVGDPDAAVFFPETDDTFPRPDAPNVPGGNDIAVFNVLNYFNTFGDSDVLRGATNQEDFEVQTAKIVDAITRLDARIVGLVEVENDYEDLYDGDRATVPAVRTLVDQLNAAEGWRKWAYVRPQERILTDEGLGGGGLGTDAIAVGIIYQRWRALPLGPAATFDIDALLTGDSENNRWPLAQTFLVDGHVATVVVNHFKSKGSTCEDTAGPGFALGEDDGSTLAGNCDLTRRHAAARLVAWADDGATRVPTSDVLLLGDFNSYEEEGPIEVLVDAGYVDLVERDGDDASTYKFDGRYGRLDYVFASRSLQHDVRDAAVWQINSPAPVGYLYDNDPIDETAHASSDHDPVVVSLRNQRFPWRWSGSGPHGSP